MFDILQQLFGQKPNMLRPQQSTNNLLPPSAAQGTIAQGPDGKNYQYAETNGMAGAKGPNGWLETSMPAQGGLMDRYKAFTASDKGQTLNDLFTGWAMGSTPQQSLGLGAAQLSKGRDARKAKEQQNQTVDWLKGQGLDDTKARLVASQPTVLADYLKNQLGGGKTDDFQARAAAAQQYGMDINTPEGRNFILTGKLPEERGGAAEMSLNTIPVMVDGKAGLLQVDKAGKGHVTELPAGASIAKAPMIKDTGTEFQVIDPVTREVVQTIPKNVAAAAAQTKIGEAQGAAAFDLPRVEQNANQTLDVLDRMKNHKGREGSTGFIQGMLPSRSSDQVDFQSLVDQTQGQSFLQAFQSLKGSGAITDIEGEKATKAISRLGNQRLSDADYLQAINDFEDVIKTGLARAQQQAGGVAPAPMGGGQTQPKRLKFDAATGTLK